MKGNRFTEIYENNVEFLADRTKVPDQKVRWAESIDVSSADKSYTEEVFLYIVTGGDVEVTTKAGTSVIFKNVADGSFLPVEVLAIHTANTTATDILACRG